MKRFVRIIFPLFLVYSALSFVIGLISSANLQYDDYEEYGYDDGCNEYSHADTLQTDVVFSHFRSWNKYSYDSIYCLSYTLASSDVSPSSLFRNNLNIRGDNYQDYWKNVYYELYQNDATSITFLKDSLQNLAIKNSFTRSDFARLIVSFVQDIPYNYVLPGPCDRNDHPCRGNEKFGILSPIEFLYSLSGDCDTRSVLLYDLLKHFGYHPLIMISYEYRHAMIAIDLPALGDHIFHKGRKFYFWETTNTGWLPGMLPPDMNNLAYWKITLDHEY